MEPVPAVAGGARVLTIMSGGERFALPAGDVSEIIRPPALTRVPLAPASLLGVANLRGVALPVISLVDDAAGGARKTASSRIVVVARPEQLGIWVDAMPSLDAGSDAPPAPLEALLARDFGAALREGAPGEWRVRDHGHAGAAGSSQAAGGVTSLIVFAVGGQDYALELRDVLEVIAMPGAVSRLPGAGAEMLGVASLRGALLPLISLAALLGLPGSGTAPACVVVTRIGPHVAGLAVDRVRAILHAPVNTIDAVPAVLSRGRGEAKVRAICRRGDGRLISILAPEGLFEADTIARLVAAGEAAGTSDGVPDHAPAGAEAAEQCVGFRLGGEAYGIPAACVDEVVRRPAQVTRLPHAPDFLVGLMNLRGQAVPLIDQRTRFGVPAAEAGAGRLVLVMTVGGRRAGVVIDSVTGMTRLGRTQPHSQQALAGHLSPVIDRAEAVAGQGRMTLLVDAAALMSDAARGLLEALGDRTAARPA